LEKNIFRLNINKISFIDIRHDVLDSFYTNLVFKPVTNLPYDKALDYVLYGFESGFSEIENFIVDFVVYVLCSDFDASKELSLIIERNLLAIIQSKDFDCLVGQVREGQDEREELIIGLCMKNLISQERMDSLLER
jgi:hypothetical protein